MSRPARSTRQRRSQTVSDDRLIDVILSHEGSDYTNDPDDTGGPTKWGITLADLIAWRGHLCTADDVKQLLRTEAAAIYRSRYIRPFDFIAALEPLRTNVVDMGVNAGVSRSTVLLQEMVGTVVDGKIGPATVRACSAQTPDRWNALFVGFRLSFYENLIQKKSSQLKWRRGWRNRAFWFLSPPTKIARPSLAASLKMAKAYD
jgi:lysozyme family protein